MLVKFVYLMLRSSHPAARNLPMLRTPLRRAAPPPRAVAVRAALPSRKALPAAMAAGSPRRSGRRNGGSVPVMGFLRDFLRDGSLLDP